MLVGVKVNFETIEKFEDCLNFCSSHNRKFILKKSEEKDYYSYENKERERYILTSSQNPKKTTLYFIKNLIFDYLILFEENNKVVKIAKNNRATNLVEYFTNEKERVNLKPKRLLRENDYNIDKLKKIFNEIKILPVLEEKIHKFVSKLEKNNEEEIREKTKQLIALYIFSKGNKNANEILEANKSIKIKELLKLLVEDEVKKINYIDYSEIEEYYQPLINLQIKHGNAFMEFIQDIINWLTHFPVETDTKVVHCNSVNLSLFSNLFSVSTVFSLKDYLSTIINVSNKEQTILNYCEYVNMLDQYIENIEKIHIDASDDLQISLFFQILQDSHLDEVFPLSRIIYQNEDTVNVLLLLMYIKNILKINKVQMRKNKNHVWLSIRVNERKSPEWHLGNITQEKIEKNKLKKDTKSKCIFAFFKLKNFIKNIHYFSGYKNLIFFMDANEQIISLFSRDLYKSKNNLFLLNHDKNIYESKVKYLNSFELITFYLSSIPILSEYKFTNLKAIAEEEKLPIERLDKQKKQNKEKKNVFIMHEEFPYIFDQINGKPKTNNAYVIEADIDNAKIHLVDGWLNSKQYASLIQLLSPFYENKLTEKTLEYILIPQIEKDNLITFKLINHLRRLSKSLNYYYKKIRNREANEIWEYHNFFSRTFEAMIFTYFFDKKSYNKISKKIENTIESENIEGKKIQKEKANEMKFMLSSIVQKMSANKDLKEECSSAINNYLYLRILKVQEIKDLFDKKTN